MEPKLPSHLRECNFEYDSPDCCTQWEYAEVLKQTCALWATKSPHLPVCRLAMTVSRALLEPAILYEQILV